MQVSIILREFIVHVDCSEIVAVGALMSRLDPTQTGPDARMRRIQSSSVGVEGFLRQSV